MKNIKMLWAALAVSQLTVLPPAAFAGDIIRSDAKDRKSTRLNSSHT